MDQSSSKTSSSVPTIVEVDLGNRSYPIYIGSGLLYQPDLLQRGHNLLELIEKMNLSVAEEYNGFGHVASGLRVFVEQLKSKCGNFDEHVQQIDVIEQQVIEFEAIILVLDKYVSSYRNHRKCIMFTRFHRHKYSSSLYSLPKLIKFD